MLLYRFALGRRWLVVIGVLLAGSAWVRAEPPGGLQAVAEALATETVQGVQAGTAPSDTFYRVGVLAFQVNHGPAPASLSSASRTLNAQYVESLRQLNKGIVARREAAIQAEPGRAVEIRRDPSLATFRILDPVELSVPAEESGVEVRSGALGDPGRTGPLLQRLGLDVLVSANLKVDPKTFGDPGLAEGQFSRSPVEVELSWVDAAGTPSTLKRQIPGEALPMPSENAAKVRDKPPEEGGSRFFVQVYRADSTDPKLPEKAPIPLKQVDPRVAAHYPAFQRVLFYEVDPNYRGRLFVEIGVRPGPPIGYKNPDTDVEASRLYAASMLVEGVDSFALPDPTSEDPKRPRYRLASADRAGLWLLSPPGKVVLAAGTTDPEPKAAQGQAYKLVDAREGQRDHASHMIQGFQTSDGSARAFTFSDRGVAGTLTADPGLLSREQGAITVTFYAQKREGDEKVAASLGRPEIGAGEEVEQRIQRIRLTRHDKPVDTWRIFFYRPDAPSESLPPPAHLVAIPVWLPGTGQ